MLCKRLVKPAFAVLQAHMQIVFLRHFCSRPTVTPWRKAAVFSAARRRLDNSGGSSKNLFSLASRVPARLCVVLPIPDFSPVVWKKAVPRGIT
jgi:hypothetical protein